MRNYRLQGWEKPDTGVPVSEATPTPASASAPEKTLEAPIPQSPTPVQAKLETPERATASKDAASPWG
ncbi:hypothetical protein NDU88_001261 [Pleurodeles waltl]|uniref:Uncharacterized protein n=1 Tax=Pleurodeles waltl TaxID=8319 RepID=A0AAV7R8I2_PLEWA|nr:hypothetical protein NDU88_001261 [Pleurodeles waltl]